MVEYIVYDHAMEDYAAIKNCSTDMNLLIWKDVYDIPKGRKAGYKIICTIYNHTLKKKTSRIVDSFKSPPVRKLPGC